MNDPITLLPTADDNRILHWYDFLCPFCYVGLHRTEILVQAGFEVIELPFQAHPEIPFGGIEAGPRDGPMYRMLEREARQAGLPLNWPPRLPNSRIALAAAEWLRRYQPEMFKQFNEDIFAAHFVQGENIGDPAVIDRHALRLGVDLDGLHRAFADGSALAAVSDSENLGRQYGVQGTPAWLLRQRLIAGLLPVEEFNALASKDREPLTPAA